MSYQENGLNISLEAAADLSGAQFRGVVVNASGQITLAALDNVFVGVLQDNPDAIGQAAAVRFTGVTKAVAGAAVTAGGRLVTDANGAFIPVGANSNPGATALESGAAGEIIAILLD